MQCWKQLFASIRKRFRHTRVFANSLPKHNRNNMRFVELRCEKKRLTSTVGRHLRDVEESRTSWGFFLRPTAQSTARKMLEVRPEPVQSERLLAYMLQKRRTLILVRVALQEKTPNPGESVQSGGSACVMVGSSVTPTEMKIMRKIIRKMLYSRGARCYTHE